MPACNLHFYSMAASFQQVEFQSQRINACPDFTDDAVEKVHLRRFRIFLIAIDESALKINN
jgi:hypothetical protein